MYTGQSYPTRGYTGQSYPTRGKTENPGLLYPRDLGGLGYYTRGTWEAWVILDPRDLGSLGYSGPAGKGGIKPGYDPRVKEELSLVMTRGK